MNLGQTAITYLRGVGPSRAALMVSELGIYTYSDLVNFFPFRYIDKSKFYKISELQPSGAEVQIIGKITGVRTVKQKRGSRLVAVFQDETGSMELIWFRGAKWIKDNLKTGQPYVVFGKTNFYNGDFSIAHPEMDLLSEYKKKISTGLQAVYPSTEKLVNKGVSNRVISLMQETLLKEFYGKFTENLTDNLRKQYELVDKNTALLNIHFPKDLNHLAQAQRRLKFEELFYIQLQLIRKNLLQKLKFKGFVFEKVGSYFNHFYEHILPFELTSAQKRVIKEIRKDVATGAQMNRLLQGDVGSGKTMVALLAMLFALDNGFQAALMAPTEILATQHFQSISELIEPLDIEVVLLTGSTKTSRRKYIHQGLESGQVKIIIGTHALLEDKVKFQNLGLAIIDEQHRFGVAQRAKMWKKNALPPHVLVMTATPIPRTLAMSVYGDLDISVIDELPPGRKSIKTVHRYDRNRLTVFKFIRDEIEKGRQIYIVYPLIQESEAMDYKDLMDGYESISREFPLPKYRISIVHGKMKPTDKDLEMQRFVKGETQIMVATTVIEVGVNVPNASVMIIESAERFGLSQLHQLRGRVGRGAEQSYCILMSGHKLSAEAKTRLETMVKTNDGFEIAEVDLKLRGPGNIMGTQQSGVLNMRIADLVKDQELLNLAREAAKTILQEDANLSKPEHKKILKTYEDIHRKTGVWSNIS
ncbi:ATP-dependent DNA helicase RecG [Flavobacteriaceae bacterium]|nr:ATP-dependent DNA helicase RecG [Flavobacteriaceae bacterium]